MKLLLPIAILGISTCSLLAHRSWVLPSMSIFSSDGAWVTFDAAISNDLFFPNHHAMGLEDMKAYAPDGKEVSLENKSDGEIRSTFDLQLNQSGTYKIQSRRGMLSARWEEAGEKKRWRGNVEGFEKSDMSSKEGIELTDYNVISETYITNGKPDKVALAPSKKGLELSFTNTHPNDLFTGEKSTFTLLYDGKPIEGIGVEVYQGNDRFRDKVEPLKATSDKEGHFSISFEEAGRYWLSASYEFDAPDMKGVPVKKAFSINATFEVFTE